MSTLSDDQLKSILEAALYAAGQPLTLERLQSLFAEHEQPGRERIRQALDVLTEDMNERPVTLHVVGTGYRVQVRAQYAEWVSRLWEEKPARLSRAVMETLALIAYRQPVTRGEIEEIRGVAVSTNIVRTLLDREWIRVVGHRDVPGKPALYGTTREFLDHFDLASLDKLPTLAELRDIETLNAELDLQVPGEEPPKVPEQAERPADAGLGEADQVMKDDEQQGSGAQAMGGEDEQGPGAQALDEEDEQDPEALTMQKGHGQAPDNLPVSQNPAQGSSVVRFPAADLDEVSAATTSDSDDPERQDS